MNLHNNTVIAELARQQSIETSAKVYAVDASGRGAVYIDGHMLRWAYIDDIEITYSDKDAAKWEKILHGTKH
jgi:hypothetical protein